MTAEKTTFFSINHAFLVSLGGLSLVGLVPGCLPQFVDDVSQVEEFRVLAVRALPAEVAPGEPVSLSVLWATKAGEAVEETDVTWGLCTKRKELTELGPLAPECLDDFGDEESEIVQYLGNGESVDAVIARDVCRLFGPLAPAAEPGSTVGGRPTDPDLTGGFYQPVLVGLDEPAAGSIRLLCGPSGLSVEELISFNRGYRPNEHPAFASVTRQGDSSSEEIAADETLELSPGEELRLQATWAACPEAPECGDGLCTAGENSTDCATDCQTEPVGCTGAESYLLADVETRTTVTRREKLSLAWFTTGGTFEGSVTDDLDENGSTENVWTAPDEPAALRIWLVLRDDRGGVAWRTINVVVGG